MNTILEIAARWKTTINTEHLLRMASYWAETRREEKKKIVRVSWEALYYLQTVNRHGTQNIKRDVSLFTCLTGARTVAVDSVNKWQAQGFYDDQVHTYSNRGRGGGGENARVELTRKFKGDKDAYFITTREIQTRDKMCTGRNYKGSDELGACELALSCFKPIPYQVKINVYRQK